MYGEKRGKKQKKNKKKEKGKKGKREKGMATAVVHLLTWCAASSVLQAGEHVQPAAPVTGRGPARSTSLNKAALVAGGFCDGEGP